MYLTGFVWRIWWDIEVRHVASDLSSITHIDCLKNVRHVVASVFYRKRTAVFHFHKEQPSVKVICFGLCGADEWLCRWHVEAPLRAYWSTRAAGFGWPAETEQPIISVFSHLLWTTYICFVVALFCNVKRAKVKYIWRTIVISILR